MQFSFRCTHAARHTPIPARSPAEREGQNSNETRRGGGEIEEHYKWQGQGGRMERLCEEKKED